MNRSLQLTALDPISNIQGEFLRMLIFGAPLSEHAVQGFSVLCTKTIPTKIESHSFLHF